MTMTEAELATLPVSEFAFPGPLRDQLVAAILDGSKTTTASLFEQYQVPGEELPQAARLEAVIDSEGRRVAAIETTQVLVVPLGQVPLEHAIAEGEGYTSVAEWRAGHERFWTSAELATELGHTPQLSDSTMVVLETFRVV
ncbi:ASCH domain-containing protein [Galactobacter caseinivorans]|nr:ASCH domain-containing protein [Galactobacter caseinivorans]